MWSGSPNVIFRDMKVPTMPTRMIYIYTQQQQSYVRADFPVTKCLQNTVNYSLVKSKKTEQNQIRQHFHAWNENVWYPNKKL